MEWMTVDEKFMRRCMELARKGAGYTAPNPMVGAVIVHEGKIIGEGFHRKCGEAHAEVNAIASVKEKNLALLPEATLYVNLEPCSHYGKTPPCAELIRSKRIPRVVVGCLDPYPEVSGRGVNMLRNAGIEVISGVLQQEAQELNAAFMTFQLQKRPYVYLKWAQSADGFLDRKRTDTTHPPVQFSSAETRRIVHRLRAEVAAIMVGTNTVLLDNPSLSVRHWVGHAPVRVAFDRALRIPSSSYILDGTVRTLIFTEKPAENRPNIEYIQIDFEQEPIQQVLSALYERKLNSLMVEGGRQLLNSFLRTGLWDEARVEISPNKLGNGIPAPMISGRLAGSEIRENRLLKRFKRDDFTD